MKQNKPQAASLGHENKASSDESNEPNSNAAKVTTPANEEYSDSIDHCQEELQQVALLDSELVESKGNSLTITTRISSFVPNFLARSRHQKTSDSYSVSEEARNATTALGAVRKMKRNGESNISANSGDVIDRDLESNQKANNKHSCGFVCCISLLVMALCAGVVLAVIFVLSPKVLDKEDKCFNGNKAFQNHNLFSTKTLYSTAINYLDSSTPKLAGSTHDIDTYVSGSVIKPDIFSADLTLKQLNNHLTVREGCKVRQFHFYGRHAARGPDSDGIKQLNDRIKDLLSRINVGRHAPAAALQQPAGQATSETPLSDDATRVQNVNTSEAICYDPMEELTSWSNYMHPEEGNLITEFGYRESEAIARRLRDIYPDLFNGSVTTISFSTTDEIRTAQTALSFLNQMANPPEVGCTPSLFPRPINLDPDQANRINSDPCFKDFLKKHYNEGLKFHKKCKEYSSSEVPYYSHFGLKNSTIFQIIADNLAKELTSHNNGKFGPDDAETIYDICRYETASTGKPSVWCRFFKKEDLGFMEYVSDVEDYVKEAYGLGEFVRSTCFITKDMMNMIGSYAAKKTQKPEAYFHFTHSSVIQKLIAATIDLREEAYKSTSVRAAMKTGDVPQKRRWRTSLLTPFSANIAFTLYDCDKTANTSMSGEGVAREIDLNPLKVVASLNEQPIKMDGCSDYACDYLSFKTSGLAKYADPIGCEYSKLCLHSTDVD